MDDFADIDVWEVEDPGFELDDVHVDGPEALQQPQATGRCFARLPTSKACGTDDTFAHLVSEADRACGHRSRQIVRRAIGKVSSQLTEQKDDMNAVAQAWDIGVLPIGNQMAWVCGSDDTQCQHPLAWDPRGLLKLAFSSVGCCPAPRSRETTRANDACAAVALAASDATRARVRELLNAAQANGTDFFVVKLAGDATPMNLRYGALADMLSKVGRHWHRESARSNRTLCRKPLCNTVVLASVSRAGFWKSSPCVEVYILSSTLREWMLLHCEVLTFRRDR